MQRMLENNKYRFAQLSNSALDPLITSGTMFFVQGLVLVTANKVEFAIFSLAVSYIVMGQTALSAMFGAPLITVLSNSGDVTQQRDLRQGMLRLQLGLSVSLAAIALAIAVPSGFSFSLTIPALFAFIGLSFRDALRNTLAVELAFEHALRLSIAFAFLTIISVIVLFLRYHTISAKFALVALAMGSVVTLSSQIISTLRTQSRASRESVLKLLSMTAWTLPGAMVIWVQNSFYLTILALNLDLSVVGEVSMTRMAIMPFLIISSGLMRFVQIRASHQLNSDSISTVVSVWQKPALAFWAFGIIISLIVIFILPTFPLSIHINNYQDLSKLIGCWLLFATSQIARNIISSVYQAVGFYREIFYYNLFIAPFVLAGIIIAPYYAGAFGAVVPMAMGESALFFILIIRARMTFY